MPSFMAVSIALAFIHALTYPNDADDVCVCVCVCVI
jgi:hypothetical protein